MIPQEELSKMDLPTIEKEVGKRRELIKQMVGTLYPSIVADEIAQLCERRAELMHGV